MADRHLNLFYTYNRDNQLIENNLTRAWIVTLGFLSAPVRDGWLRSLLQEPLMRLGQRIDSLPSLAQALCSLQDWMHVETTRAFPTAYVLTIAGDSLDLAEAEDNPCRSIPDGWIYDVTAGYCFLVESKLHGNPLDEAQVVAHANHWLGISAADLPRHLLSITWVDVARSIEQVVAGQLPNATPNEQEIQILVHLSNYLSFYGYRIFSGFDFQGLTYAPTLCIGHSKSLFWAYFDQLGAPPSLRLPLS